MSLLKLFGFLRQAAPATPSPASPAQGAPAAQPPVEEIALEARALAAAWSPAGRRLSVATPSPLGRGRRVQVNVSGLGGATLGLGGVVTGACATAGGWFADVALDEDRVPVVERLLELLRGGAEVLRARAPRYRLVLPAIVIWESGHTFMQTFSVSRGGCGLTWSGPPPTEGRGVHVRLGSGSRAASFSAMVCWVRGDGRGTRVGLRFLGGDQSELAQLLAAGRPDH